MNSKRTYKRRSDEERIAELRSRISSLQKKLEHQKRPDEVVLREIPKVQKRLRRFAQMAVDNGRADLANSTMAFMAGLDRMGGTLAEVSSRRKRGEAEQDGHEEDEE